MFVAPVTQLLTVNRFNYTSWVAVVTPTDRLKSVRNRCPIEGFGDGFLLSRCFLDFSVGLGAFVIGLSQDVEILHPVKFRSIPFSGFSEVGNVKN